MGKYKLEEASKEEILVDISNELAESNRLKRLEINYLYAQDGDTPIPELEDKA